MRVAFITDYLNNLSGTEAALVAMATALAHRGHRILVCVQPREGLPHPYWKSQLNMSVELYYTDRVNELTPNIALVNKVEAWRSDVLVFLPMGELAMSWLQNRLLPGVPRIGIETTQVDGYWNEHESYNIFKEMDAIAAMGQRMKRALRDRLGHGVPVVVVPPIVDVSKRQQRPLSCKDLENALDLGAITRLRVEKGPEFMVAAVALLAEDFDVTLTIYGPRLERERTMDVARALGVVERINLHGSYKGSEALDRLIYRHAILLLSSLTEGFPLSVIEAMGRGRVVVGTDVGGVAEMLVPNQSGLVVTPGDPRGMAEAVSTLLRTPERLLTMSRNAVGAYRKYFQTTETIKKFEDLSALVKRR